MSLITAGSSIVPSAFNSESWSPTLSSNLNNLVGNSFGRSNVSTCYLFMNREYLGSASANALLATIPAGHRPNHTVYTAGSVDYGIRGVPIVISTNGEIRLAYGSMNYKSPITFGVVYFRGDTVATANRISLSTGNKLSATTFQTESFTPTLQSNVSGECFGRCSSYVSTIYIHLTYTGSTASNWTIIGQVPAGFQANNAYYNTAVKSNSNINYTGVMLLSEGFSIDGYYIYLYHPENGVIYHGSLTYFRA